MSLPLKQCRRDSSRTSERPASPCSRPNWAYARACRIWLAWSHRGFVDFDRMSRKVFNLNLLEPYLIRIEHVNYEEYF